MLLAADCQIDRRTFNKFRRIIYERSGIKLGERKEALVVARVGKRMRALGITDHREYLKYVIEDATEGELVRLLDAVSTNVTSFFREAEHFAFLQDTVSGWVRNGMRRLRIWSAACSSGEEPYSIAIALREAVGQAPMNMRILATDISTEVLEQARSRVYVEERIKPVSAQLRARYFDRVDRPEGVCYRVKPQLAEMVVLKRLNLSITPFPMRGPLDVVFCRNVMIYFDRLLRQRLLEEIYRLLRTDGYLLVGHAESLTGVSNAFRAVRPSIYLKS